MTQDEQNYLLELANEARRRAYAPYSNYRVGAALRTRSGRLFTGVNVENAAYPTTMCAERVAIYKAVSEGELEFEAIAVATSNGGSPCGSCRQVLAEFGLETLVIIGNETGQILSTASVAELLPGAFTPKELRR
jgi:cytidine deaminase